MSELDALKVYTTGQLAEWLTEQGVPTTGETVRGWCRDQKISRIRTPGGQYLILAEAARAILTPSGTDPARALADADNTAT